MEDASPEMLSIFAGAIERPSPEERAAFLDTACGADLELRRRIEALLRAHNEAGGFLQDRPETSNPVATFDQPTTEGPDPVIGPYKLLEQIGEGGFGVVFLAEQTEPVRRRVALKVLKPGMDTRQVVARFEAERQALALMDHPHIAKVLDGGATESGRPYFVMELVKGVPITEYCDQHHLTPRQRLELFIPVCQAVQHAHQKGIIHRDLKPSNVLVTVHDTTPVPKIIDFGIAKALGQELTDKTLFTGFAQMIGTPLYMSPEQAGQSGLDIDTRSDIYALGVLLYELLTGTTPFTKERFQRAAYDEIRRIIREEDPPRPSTRLSESTESLPSISAQRQTEPAKLTRLVRGELDWIVMKCLEKDRNRRYDTANSLAMDVQRYLCDEPVLAGPPSAIYRFRKFARRNKAPLLMAGMVVGALMTTVALLVIAIVLISKEKNQTAYERDQANGAREMADHQAEEAKRNADVAARQRDLALRTIEGLIFEAQKLAEDKPGTLKLRKALLAKALEGLTEVARSADNARTIDSNTATAHERLGTIFVLLGDTKEARAQYEKFHALTRSLSEADPGDALAKERLADAHHQLGDVALKTGDTSAGKRHYDQSAEIFHGLVDASPVATGPRRLWCRRTLAVVLRKLGHVSVLLGDTATARTYFNQALKLNEELAEQAPQRHELYDECQRERAIAHSTLGTFNLSRLGNAAAARDHYQKSLDYFQAWEAAHPGSVEAKHDLMVEYQNLAGVTEKLGEVPKALGHYEKARDLAEWLVKANPDSAEARGSLLQIHGRLGEIYYGTNDMAGATKECDEAMRIAKELAKDRDNVQAQRDLASCVHLQAKISARTGDKGAAEKQYREVLEISQKLIAKDPNSAKAKSELAVAYSEFGQFIHYQLQDHQAAREYLLDSLKLRTEIAEADPQNAWAQRELALACTWLGMLSARTGNFAAGRQYYEKALEHQETVANIDPENLDAQRELAAACERLANLALAPEDAPTHLRYHQQVLEIYERLLRKDPANEDTRRGLAFAHEAVGAAKFGLEGESAAWGHFREALALFDALPPPSAGLHPQVKIKLSIAHNRLAWFLITCRDPKFRDPPRAVRLARKTTDLFPQYGMYWNTLGVAQYRAGDWQAAVAALEKSTRLQEGGDPTDWFFLAMAHRQLGHKEEARPWYDRAVQWMEKHQTALDRDKPRAEEFRRFRSEAEEALGLK
jgi:eukaryotic-like serine/threonine-protein kinase